MSLRPFRQHHILAVLEEYEKQELPLDYFLSKYFRNHKALGSKDRGVVAEMVYGLIRWRGLLDFACSSTLSWENRLDFFLSPEFMTYKFRKDIPPHIRLSFPQVLFEKIVNSHGMDKACEICAASNEPAPTTVRANALKTTREDLLQRWRNTYPVRPCADAPYGITFDRRLNFFELPEFKQGFFEVQDEGSQLVAGLVEASPGQHIMDYCAGSGGKTLAFAPNMKNTGQIFLHDIRKHALQDCKKRLRRAGIQNAQVVFEDEGKLKKLKKSMDWVLVDAPCSGTGTLRRNPDMKWKFNEEMLIRLMGQQRMIFEKALSYMKPEGRIVYATCSVLKEENMDQVSHFMKVYDLEIVDKPFESLPFFKKMDGFFGVIFKKIIHN